MKKKKTAKIADKKSKNREISSVRSSRPKTKKVFTDVKVVGIGGGGGNAVSRMFTSERLKGVEFIAVNTDVQDLDTVSSHKKIYIGKALTHGLGAGMNPEIGKQAAEENRSEIGEVLDGADLVFITAGLGGGTGTGAGPVIADIAREKGILTLAVVTKPFAFEGGQRMKIAEEGLMRLKEKVDAFMVIPNDRIFSLINKETPILKAFGYIDDILKNFVKTITELINSPGIINVDFADIKTILRDAGPTLIGVGLASGQDRSIRAAGQALNSPLLEVTIDGAKGALFSISGGRDMRITEINDIAKIISANLDSNARVIFGAYHDRSLKDNAIKVMIIATGFNGVFSQRSAAPTLFIENFSRLSDIKNEENKAQERENSSDDGEKDEKETGRSSAKSDPWEIPTFLRKKRR